MKKIEETLANLAQEREKICTRYTRVEKVQVDSAEAKAEAKKVLDALKVELATIDEKVRMERISLEIETVLFAASPEADEPVAK